VATAGCPPSTGAISTAGIRQFVPIAKERIAIEIEYTEIWYRRIDVKPQR
jgi:hypothetical protein